MDNCLTPKKAIARLNRLTGVKWTFWHGKSTAIKRCVVSLTPVTNNNMDSSLQYLMPMGYPPVFGPELFVKMYFKGKANRMAFLPAVRYDFDSLFLPDIELTPYGFDIYTIVLSAKLTGQMLIRRHGDINNASVSVNNLRNFEINASMVLNNFQNSLYTESLDLSTKQITIGNHVVNEFWTTSFELRGTTLTATINPQPIKLSIPGFDIIGNLGFEISGTLVPKKPNFAPVHSAVQISNSSARIEIVFSIIILQPLVKIGNTLAEIRDTLGPFAELL